MSSRLQNETLVVARVEGTNEFLAYSKIVGKWNSFTFPEGVTKAVPVLGRNICVFHLEGEAISEVVAVDLKGNWCSSKLPAAAKRCIPSVGAEVAVCVVGDTAHAFSGAVGKWDSVARTVAPVAANGMVMMCAPDSISIFSSATGKWAVAKTTK